MISVEDEELLRLRMAIVPDFVPNEEFDRMVRLFGYVKERTCEMPMVFEDEDGNEYDNSAAYFRYFRCSSCGEAHERYKHEFYSFCPYCGAKVVD